MCWSSLERASWEWLVLQKLSSGPGREMSLSFRVEKREKRKKIPVQWEVKREKEEKINSIVWEVKRENKYFSHFLGSEKRKLNVFLFFGKWKEKKNMQFPGNFQVKSESEIQLKKVNSLICCQICWFFFLLIFFLSLFTSGKQWEMTIFPHKSGRETGRETGREMEKFYPFPDEKCEKKKKKISSRGKQDSRPLLLSRSISGAQTPLT